MSLFPPLLFSFFLDFIFHLPYSPIFLSLSFFFSTSVRHYFSFTIAFFVPVPVFFSPSLPLFSLFFSSTFSLGHPRVLFFTYVFFFLSSIQFLSVLVRAWLIVRFPLHFVPVPVSLFAPRSLRPVSLPPYTGASVAPATHARVSPARVSHLRVVPPDFLSSSPRRPLFYGRSSFFFLVLSFSSSFLPPPLFPFFFDLPPFLFQPILAYVRTGNAYVKYHQLTGIPEIYRFFFCSRITVISIFPFRLDRGSIRLKKKIKRERERELLTIECRRN